MPPRTESPYGGGQLLGANALQQALDRLTTAIQANTTKLSSLASQVGTGGPGPFYGRAGGGTGSSFPPVSNPFTPAGMMSGTGYRGPFAGSYTPATFTPASRWPPGSTNATGTPIGGQFMSRQQASRGIGLSVDQVNQGTAGTGGTPGGNIPWTPFNPPSQPTFTRYGGQPPNSPGGGFARNFAGGYSGRPTASNFATIGGSLGAVASSLVAFGQSQFNQQVVASSYITQAALGAPTNMTFGQINSQLRNQAFGTGGYGGNVNTIGFGTQDISQGSLALNYIGGAYNPATTAIGRAALGATNAFGYVNPQLGYAGAAGMAGTLYNPQLSMNMRMLGYGVTPRGIGGSPPAMTGQVIQGMIQRWYGKGTVSPQQLALTLGQGGRGNLNLQYGLGLNQSQIASMSPTIQAYNQLFQRGVSATRANQLFTQAGQGNQGAMNTLTSLGVPESDLQRIKTAQAQKTARTSDESTGFNQGLAQATNLLTQFNKALTSLLQNTGMMGPLGFAGGFGSTMSNLSGGVGSGLLGALGGGLLAKFGLGGLLKGGGGILGKLFGGGKSILGRIFGGGGAEAGAAGEAGTAAEAAGGGILGTLGAALGPVGAGIAGGLGLNWLNSLAMKGNKKAGAVNAGASIFSDIPAGGLIDRILQLFGSSSGTSTTSGSVTGRFGPINGFPNSTPSQSGGAASIPQTRAPSSSSGGTPKKQNGGGPTMQAIEAVTTAERYLGWPYLWGGASPQQGGFDCSGLVEYAYSTAGVSLPRTSQDQWAFLNSKGRSINLKNVQEGDIVFTAGGDGTTAAPGHEGLMISRTQLIQAPHTGTDIQIIPFDAGGWDHAARPVGGLQGSGTGPGGPGGGTNAGQNTPPTMSHGVGNTGAAFGANESTMMTFTGEAGALGAGGAPGSGTQQFNPSLNNQPGPSGPGGKHGRTTSQSGGTAQQNQNIAASVFGSYGWGAANMSNEQWGDLIKLWTQESSWSNTADNSSSGAYGIAQALPPTKYPVAGRPPWLGGTSNAGTQITWGLQYIAGRYGNPKTAWGHEVAFNWYGRGTRNAYPGWAVVGENGPELMPMRGGEQIYNANETRQIMNSNQPMPCVNITFAKGAICVNSGSAATGSDASHAGRQLAQALLDNLEAEKIYKAIGMGHKN